MPTARLLICSILLLLPHGYAQGRTPVLVELFSSEGCSSCPPADALLARLEREQPVAGAEIIVLGEHVDYWDSLGWHDRFSSRQFTERQGAYSRHFQAAEVYTPQMVVNGTSQFVGSDARDALQSLTRASRAATLPLSLSATHLDGKAVAASVSLPPGSPPKLHGDLYAALVSTAEITQVRAGENGGRTLRHAGVVRTMQRVGEAEALPIAFTLAAPAGPEPPAGWRIVVLAQESGTGRILAAAMRPVDGTPREFNPAQARLR